MAGITVKFKGVDFDIEYDYQPEEPMVMYYPDGSGYPGCAESVDVINSITHQGTDFTEFLEDFDEEIKQLILETRR